MTTRDDLNRHADRNRRVDNAGGLNGAAEREAKYRAALASIADHCADGVVTLGQIEDVARRALKGEP